MRGVNLHVYDVVSIIGVIIILGTYFLLQVGKIDPRGYSYSILNIVGSLMILYSLLFDWNLSAVIIELFWAVISFVGLLKQFFKR